MQGSPPPLPPSQPPPPPSTCMGWAAAMPALVHDITASMQRLVGPRPSAVLAPAPRRPLRPQRATCVVRAGALDELEAWQRDRLQQAAAAGRRQVKVRPGAPAAGFEPTKNCRQLCALD